jgi:hypothetical protein
MSVAIGSSIDRSVFLPGGNGTANALPSLCNQFNYLKVTADMSGVPGGTDDQTVYVPCYWTDTP